MVGETGKGEGRERRPGLISDFSLKFTWKLEKRSK
jgi:hypothetical protein